MVNTNPVSRHDTQSVSRSGWNNLRRRPAMSAPQPKGARETMVRFISAPPAMRLHRLGGEKQSEAEEGQIVDDVLGVDDPLGALAHMLGHREIGEDRAPAARPVFRVTDEPKDEEDGEGREHRDDLIPCETAEQNAEGEEGSA